MHLFAGDEVDLCISHYNNIMELGAFNLEVVDVCMQSFCELTHSKTI